MSFPLQALVGTADGVSVGESVLTRASASSPPQPPPDDLKLAFVATRLARLLAQGW